jgi:hypothetical protein
MFQLLLHFDMINRVSANGKAGCWVRSFATLFITCSLLHITFYDPIRASTQPLSIVGITASLFTAGSMDQQKKFENSKVDIL